MRQNSRPAPCGRRSSGTNKRLQLLVAASCLCFLAYTHLSFKWIKQKESSENRSSLRFNDDMKVTRKPSVDAYKDTKKACDHPNLLVVVLASTRFFPLLRLLMSLRDAKYECAQVNLHISIDAPKHTQMLPFMTSVVSLANSFEWPHGHKTWRQTLLHRGLSLSWFEAILPGQEDYILILEDDMEVSQYFFRFFSAVAEKQVFRDERLASICLHPTWGLDPPVDHHMSISTHWLVVRYACSWGPIWTRLALLRFRNWLLKHYGITKPYVPGLVEINKYVAQGRDVQSSWTSRFLYETGTFNLLHRVEVSSDCLGGTFLLLNHKEPGLHIKRKQYQYTDSSLLLTNFAKVNTALEALPLVNGSLSALRGDSPGIVVLNNRTFEEMGGTTATLRAQYEAEKKYSLRKNTGNTCWLNSSCSLDSKQVKKVLVDISLKNMLIGKHCLGIPESLPLDLTLLLLQYCHGIEESKNKDKVGFAAAVTVKGFKMVAFRKTQKSCESFKAELCKRGMVGTLNCLNLCKLSSWDFGPAGKAVQELFEPNSANITSASNLRPVGHMTDMGTVKEFANSSIVILNIDVLEITAGFLHEVISQLQPYLPRFLSLRLHFSSIVESKVNFLSYLIAEIYGRGYICTVINIHPKSALDAIPIFKSASMEKCKIEVKLLTQALFLPTPQQQDTGRSVEWLCFPQQDLIPIFTYNI